MMYQFDNNVSGGREDKRIYPYLIFFTTISILYLEATFRPLSAVAVTVEKNFFLPI